MSGFWTVFWSVGGGIASFVGAALSGWQSWKARKAATDAERARDQVIMFQKTSNLTRIQSASQRAQNAMRKYNHTSTLHGENVESDATMVHDAILLVMEFGPSLGRNREVTRFAEKLNKSLKTFQENSEMRKTASIAIQQNIAIFVSLITAAIDATCVQDQNKIKH